MKTIISKDTGKVSFSIDKKNWEEDFEKCRKLKDLQNNEAWFIFLNVLGEMESRYDDLMMSVKPSDVSARECQVYAARKRGLVEAISAVGKILSEYDASVKERHSDLNEQLDLMLGTGKKEPPEWED